MGGVACHSRKPKCGWLVVHAQGTVSVPLNGIFFAASLVENGFIWFRFICTHGCVLFITSLSPTCLCICFCTKGVEQNRTAICQSDVIEFLMSCVGSSLFPSHCLLFKIKWCFNYVLLCSKPSPEPRGLKQDIISRSSMGLLGPAEQFLLRLSHAVAVRWWSTVSSVGTITWCGFLTAWHLGSEREIDPHKSKLSKILR